MEKLEPKNMDYFFLSEMVLLQSTGAFGVVCSGEDP
jgi:hypothetical protein